MIFRFIGAIWLILYSSTLFGLGSPVLVDGASLPKNPLNSMEILVDQPLNSTIDQVLQKDFKPIEQKVLPYTDKATWTRVEIRNTSDTEVGVFWSNEYAVAREANFYVIGTGKKENQILKTTRMGAEVSYLDLEVFTRELGIVYNLAPHESVFIYSRLVSNNPPIINYHLMYERDLATKQLENALFVGLYCGLVLGLIFYLVSYYIGAGASVRSKMLGPLITAIGGLFLQVVIYTGYPNYTFQALGLNYEDFFPSIKHLTTIGQSWFVMAFLSVKHNNQLVYRILKTNIIVSVVLMVVLLFTHSLWLLPIFDIQVVVTILTTVYAMYKAFSYARREASLFLMSFFPIMFIFTFYIFAMLIDVSVELDVLSNNVAYLASGSQILFISIGVARYADEKRKIAEQLLTDLNASLEEQVEKRTADLSVALEELRNEVVERDKLEKKLEEQRAAAINNSKFTALGEMAGGIAHEINNPLSVIRGQSEFMGLMISKGQAKPQMISQSLLAIEKMSKRIAKIISGLKVISRNAENDEKEEVRVEDIIDDTMVLCKSKLKHNEIHFTFINNLDDKGQKVPCREVQISQVLLNLLNNSIDALESLKEKWIKIEVETIEGMLKILVTDSGHGIEKSVADKIMQPFYTTKEVGKGTGLGLSISKQIMQEHGGDLVLNHGSENTQFILTMKLS